jgi:serine/threonine protein kinase/predicted Zn-dependent protease
MSESPTHESHPDAAPPPSSCSDATVEGPLEMSPDRASSSPSCSDATVEGPLEMSPDRASPSPSCSDATVEGPSATPDAAGFTMDYQPTQEADSSAVGSEEASFVVSEASCQARAKRQIQVANYEILGVLGRGAVGVVYKARQLGLNRLVALKMLLAGSHAGQRELARFRVEAEAVARLHHPNIVQVYEVGEHNGLPFFSLEFVEGGSLHQKMGGKPLPPYDAAQIMQALAGAMHYAHERNIVHRDLKPANVLLTPDGTPKITDFGLAKRLEEGEESSQTRTGTLMGTPSYMSPEQAEGRIHDIGPLSDQYALGAILYEMLTGRPPFLGATLMETIQQVRTQEPVPPTQLQTTTPCDLEVICLKALQKEPGKRYAHAGEMAEDLRRFLAGEPIRARPVSRLERLWRWCRRNPRLASLYAAVAVLIMLVASSGAVLGLRLLREQQTIARVRDQAEERLDLATSAISVGDFRRAKDLLQWSDPLLENAAGLNELHDRWKDLKGRIEVLGQFKDLLDKARFACLYGSREQKEEGRQYCRKLLRLYDYDALAQHQMLSTIGLPPLNAEQEQLFKEDVFDMFLVAAITEDGLTQNAEPALRRQVAQQALEWLNRADKILPGMRTLYTHRSGFHGALGHREESDADFQRARATQPQSAVDHFWHGYAEHIRGDAASDKGDTAKAREHYHKEIAEYAALLRQHPAHFWGYFNWAVAKVKLNDLADALIGFTTCIRLRPDFPWPYNNRGTVHLRLRQYEQALRDYSAALARNPEYIEARFDRATVYAEMKRLDDALREYDHILARNPKNALAYFKRASLREARGEYQEALADYNAAIALEPRPLRYHYRAVLYWLHLKDFDAALSDWQEVTKWWPDRPEAFHFRGMIHLGRRQYQLALQELEEALLRQPDYPNALWGKAEIYLWQGKAKEALDVINPLAQKLPSNYEETLNIRGDIYRHLGRFDDAAADYRRLIQLRPDLPGACEAYVNLALLYYRQGEPAKARSYLDQLVQVKPQSATAYLWRGRFLRDQGQFEEAWKDSEQAARCDASSVLPALLQASITAARGDAAAAVAAAEQILAKAPKDDGQVLYSAVQVWGLASAAAARAGQSELAQRYADRAAALLAQTLDKGFHDLDYSEHNRMIYDPALEAIRQHPQARDLIAHRPRENGN